MDGELFASGQIVLITAPVSMRDGVNGWCSLLVASGGMAYYPLPRMSGACSCPRTKRITRMIFPKCRDSGESRGGNNRKHLTGIIGGDNGVIRDFDPVLE